MWVSHSSRVRASRLRRSSGSVFDGRRLNHQSPRSTVSPSSRSWAASGCEVAYSAATASMTAAGIGHLGVDLAGVGVAVERAPDHRHGLVGGAQALEHQHGGDEPGVGPEVVAEVVVRRVLAAEGGTGGGHLGLDVGVADLGADRRAAVLAHHLGHHLGADQVVQDGGAGLLLEHAHGHQGGGGRTREPHAPLVDHEDAVGVAVEGEPDVGADLADPGAQVPLVLGLDRIGRVVREGAVELRVQDLEVERQGVEHRRDHQAAHAVGGVDHHLERPERRRVDERADVVGEGAEQVERGAGARRGHRRHGSRASSFTRSSPVSAPTGRASARQNLIPLYWAGLCEAVNMAPGAPRDPEAK